MPGYVLILGMLKCQRNQCSLISFFLFQLRNLENNEVVSETRKFWNIADKYYNKLIIS